MIGYTEHIKPFDENSDREPETGEVEGLEQLLTLPFLQRWAKLPLFREFHLGGSDCRTLSVVFEGGETWVVATITVKSLDDLVPIPLEESG